MPWPGSGQENTVAASLRVPALITPRPLPPHTLGQAQLLGNKGQLSQGLQEPPADKSTGCHPGNGALPPAWHRRARLAVIRSLRIILPPLPRAREAFAPAFPRRETRASEAGGPVSGGTNRLVDAVTVCVMGPRNPTTHTSAAVVPISLPSGRARQFAKWPGSRLHFMNSKCPRRARIGWGTCLAHDHA